MDAGERPATSSFLILAGAWMMLSALSWCLVGVLVAWVWSG
jgi:hypothetical protein